MEPERATGCGGRATLLEAVPSAPASPEKRPPEAASKMVTTTTSPTPIRRSGAPPPSPKAA